MSSELFLGGTFPLILSAPSGAGKTTIARALRKRRSDIAFSISATTRPPRAGEVDGRDYHFITTAEFRRMIDAGEFVEWAEVHGNLYGTPCKNVESAVAEGRFLILDIDVQGARQIRGRIPDAISVFVMPPSGEALVDRLLGRGSERDAVRKARLENAQEEFSAVTAFDYVVVNDDLDRAVEALEAILLAEVHRPYRMRSIDGDVARLRAEVAAAEAALPAGSEKSDQPIDRRGP